MDDALAGEGFDSPELEFEEPEEQSELELPDDLADPDDCEDPLKLTICIIKCVHLELPDSVKGLSVTKTVEAESKMSVVTGGITPTI